MQEHIMYLKHLGNDVLIKTCFLLFDEYITIKWMVELFIFYIYIYKRKSVRCLINYTLLHGYCKICWLVFNLKKLLLLYCITTMYIIQTKFIISFLNHSFLSWTLNHDLNWQLDRPSIGNCDQLDSLNWLLQFCSINIFENYL